MALTVDSFCELLTRSRLLPADGVSGLRQRWQADSSDRASVREFTRWLVAQQHLTDYQVTLLANGYADNFFVGEYRILDRIGKGRMAGVYKAMHSSGQKVALKVLPPSKAKEPEVLARFRREAQLAVQFNHPSVVRTFHFGEANGLHYLVMEHLEGDTLENLLESRRALPPREAVRIAFLTALGLQHIHEKGMVHRDLKPGNLMLCPAPGPQDNTLRSMVKILDIGLGRTLFDPKARDDALTADGVILGTPDYLAPEQARDARKADIRADLYSLGCTLYHALTGSPPFPDTNPVRQVLRHANEQPKSLQEMKVDVPDELNQIVMTLLAKDPNQRFATPAKAAEVLKAFLGAETETTRPKSEPQELETYLEAIKKPDPAAAQPVTPAAAGSPERQAKPPPSAQKVLAAKRKRSTKLKLLKAADGQAERAAAQPLVAKPVVVRAPELPMIDVEPVDLQELTEAPFGLPLNRDLFMILVGALGVLVVVTLIWGITMLFGP